MFVSCAPCVLLPGSDGEGKEQHAEPPPPNQPSALASSAVRRLLLLSVLLAGALGGVLWASMRP